MRLKNKQNSSHNNSKQRERKTPKILGLGLIRLDFYINLTEEMMKQHDIDLSKINTPKDLLFIYENQTLLDLVQLSTTDTLTNILLSINKANVQKSFVELITLNPMRFKPEEEFIRKIFAHVTEQNYLFTNEMNVATAPNKISFAIKSGKRLLRCFDIIADYDPFAEEIKKEENFTSNKSIRVEKEVIKETEEDNLRNANTQSNVNMSVRKNSKMSRNYIENNNNNESSRNNNNLDNFNNNEQSRSMNLDVNMQHNDSNSYNEDEFNKENKEIINEMVLENDENADENKQAEDEAQGSPEEKDSKSLHEDGKGVIEDPEDVENEEDKSLKRENSNVKSEVVNETQNHNAEEVISILNNPENKDKNISVFEKEKTSEAALSNKQNNSLNNNNNNENIQSKQHSFKKDTGALNNSENLDITRSNQSMFKLFNIPSACEIEEYDYIFLDLDEFLNFHGFGLHLIELADFIKKIAISAKSPRIVINFPNILLNLNIINLELIDIILSIMSYTDIFLFDKRECLAFFNMLSQMNNESELSEKNLYEHFQKEIPHIKSGVAKIGLFMDDLQKFSIIEQKGQKLVFKSEYSLNLHPKINHTNQKVIDEYKKIMHLNSNYLKSIFFGGYFAKFIFLNDHYPSFISGIESTKRILELFKNKIDFPAEQEFYLIKLQKAKIDKDLALENLRKKEEKFVLDCINKKTSSIKYYNPLFDEHLNAFFTGEVVRKQLKEKGFINTNGFVLYDPSFKHIVAPKNVKKRVDTADKEKHLLYAIKNNKDIFATDLESYSKSIKECSPTGRRLPMPANKDSSNVYFPNKLFNLKKSQKRTLKPLYLSVAKKKLDQDEKEKEKEKEIEKSLNSSLTKKNISSISNAKKPKTNNLIFQTQNYHTLNKSILNSALNKSEFNDEKNVNNISKLDNSIVDISETNKNEIEGENNNESAKEEVENNDINENLEEKEMAEEAQENIDNAEAENKEGVENANDELAASEQKNEDDNNQNPEPIENKEEIEA